MTKDKNLPRAHPLNRAEFEKWGLTPEFIKCLVQDDLPDETTIARMLNGMIPMDERIAILLVQALYGWIQEVNQVADEIANMKEDSSPMIKVVG